MRSKNRKKNCQLSAPTAMVSLRSDKKIFLDVRIELGTFRLQLPITAERDEPLRGG